LAIIAESKGRNPLLWFFIGFIPIIGLIGGVHYLTPLPDRKRLAADSSSLPRIIMAGVRGFLGGLILVAILYCGLILILCFVDANGLDGDLAPATLWRALAVGGVAGGCLCILEVNDSLKGLNSHVNEKV